MKLSTIKLPVLFLWDHYMQPFEKEEKTEQNRNAAALPALDWCDYKLFFILLKIFRFYKLSATSDNP